MLVLYEGRIIATQLVMDGLWALIKPLSFPRGPGDREPIDRRKDNASIILVLKTGLFWDDLPAEFGWDCGRTCREALTAQRRADVVQRLHEILLIEL